MQNSRIWTALGVIVVAIGTSSCQIGGASLTSTSLAPGVVATTRAPSAESVPPASTNSSRAPQTKPPLEGIIDMGVQTPYLQHQPFPTIDLSPLDAYAGAFAGVVVNEGWSQLEPKQGVYDWTPLKRSLAAVSVWNAQHSSTPVGVKLRVFAGYSAPSWVTSQSGVVTEVVHGVSVEMGRWWTPVYEAAWRTFQRALASAFDTDPLIRQVSVSSCSSSTGEPFVVSGALLSQRDLRAAGWSVGAQVACLKNALSDYANWRETPVTFAMNALYDPATPGQPDVSVLDAIARECARSGATGGPTCILGNNDLSPTLASTVLSGPLITEIQSLISQGLRPLVYFQTNGTRLSCSTIDAGLSYHARSIEVWSPRDGYPGFTVVPPAVLAQWNRALQSQSSSVPCP